MLPEADNAESTALLYLTVFNAESTALLYLTVFNADSTALLYLTVFNAESTALVARRSHILSPRPLFCQNGAKSRCWGQNMSPYAQGCDLSSTVSHIINHDRSQPWAYGIENKEVYATLCLQAKAMMMSHPTVIKPTSRPAPPQHNSVQLRLNNDKSGVRVVSARRSNPLYQSTYEGEGMEHLAALQQLQFVSASTGAREDLTTESTGEENEPVAPVVLDPASNRSSVNVTFF